MLVSVQTDYSGLLASTWISRYTVDIYTLVRFQKCTAVKHYRVQNMWKLQAKYKNDKTSSIAD